MRLRFLLLAICLNTMVFAQTESIPYQGGSKAIEKGMNANLKYPVLARDNGIDGSVKLLFNLKHNGEIDDLKIVESPGWGMDAEAIRLLRELPPHWLFKPEDEHKYHFLTVAFKLNKHLGKVEIKYKGISKDKTI